jgi:hypothetical protein
MTKQGAIDKFEIGNIWDIILDGRAVFYTGWEEGRVRKGLGILAII